MTRRPGLTLTEVLVTLAILAFGILAILTLFPLAASQMAVAVREDRSAQAANAADGYMRAYWKKEIVEKVPPVTEPFYSAFDNPGGLTAAVATEPSYPVVIDPMGYEARSAGTRDWIGDGAGTRVARRTLAAVSGNKPYSFRVCSLMDGMGYDDNGRPSAPGGPGTAEREMRYNWMWIVRCPDVGTKTVADVSVVVFDNRPNLYAPPTGPERCYSAPAVALRSTQVTLTGSVDVKPGMWIMDATVTDGSAAPKIRHADCYRVMSVADTGTVTTLELETPIKVDPAITATTFPGTFVVLRGVTAVYPRLPLTGN